MIEAIRVHVRYETKDGGDQKKNRPPETRRERNERFGELSPSINVPDEGRYLWDWYFDLSDKLTRIIDGICVAIPPTEFVAWRDATRNIVYPSEYAVLSAMDLAFRAYMNEELASHLAQGEADG